MIGNNRDEYNFYCEIDKEQKSPGLLSDPNDIPDWIKYPKGKKKSSSEKWDQFMADDTGGKRKRNKSSAVYDDGLTERQFMKMTEKQADTEEKLTRTRKRERANVAQENIVVDSRGDKLKNQGDSTTSNITSNETPPNETQEVSIENNRILISVCKVIIALKDSTTKRRLSEIFFIKTMSKNLSRLLPDYQESSCNKRYSEEM